MKMIDGRRGPRRRIVDVIGIPATTPKGLDYEKEWEVLECGHVKRRYSYKSAPHPRTNRRHCLECVREDIGRGARWDADRLRERESKALDA